MIIENIVSEVTGGHSPSAMTTHLFQLRMHHIDSVERSMGRVKKDLFGFADHVAVAAGKSHGVVKFLQSTTEANRNARIKKISANPIAKLLHNQGHEVAVVTWYKRKEQIRKIDGSESSRWRYRYRGRISTFEEEDFKC